MQALGESLGTGNDVKDMDVIDKVLRVSREILDVVLWIFADLVTLMHNEMSDFCQAAERDDILGFHLKHHHLPILGELRSEEYDAKCYSEGKLVNST